MWQKVKCRQQSKASEEPNKGSGNGEKGLREIVGRCNKQAEYSYLLVYTSNVTRGVPLKRQHWSPVDSGSM